jgi:hypothetical protein
MPLVLSFALIGFFVWVAENISTYLGAWVYAEQRAGWRVVSLWIISSWVLLVIVSFILVADLKHVRKAANQIPYRPNQSQTEKLMAFPSRTAYTPEHGLLAGSLRKPSVRPGIGRWN